MFVRIRRGTPLDPKRHLAALVQEADGRELPVPGQYLERSASEAVQNASEQEEPFRSVSGIVAGVVISEIIALFSQWSSPVSLGAILMSFAFSAAVGIFFGYYPARKAARLDPIRAPRYE
jgi:hypothetical protein